MYKIKLFIIVSGLTAWNGAYGKELFIQKNRFPDCVKVSSSCYACADGTQRKTIEKKTKLQRPLSPFECATRDMGVADKQKLVQVDGCVKLSDFCSVCAGDKFKFNDTGSFIESDLYECSTSPRVTVFNKGK